MAAGAAPFFGTRETSYQNRMNKYAEYVAKVQALLERAQNDESVLPTIVKGFHTLGQKYFANTRSGYIGGPEEGEEAEEDIPEMKTYTKEEFIAQVVAWMGEDMREVVQESDEATFSDAYRHAGLIDIETLQVIDPTSIGIPMTDHVFTWSIVQTLPEKLAGTNYIALHADTEDGINLFFPMPTKQTGGKRKRSSSRKGRGKAKRRNTRKAVE